uniref:Uncharacterized protein n=1 Tax=Kalanchoe fedtschenkoi TaxID=63787 RepID=A0A7N0UCS7_KALFE
MRHFQANDLHRSILRKTISKGAEVEGLERDGGSIRRSHLTSHTPHDSRGDTSTLAASQFTGAVYSSAGHAQHRIHVGVSHLQKQPPDRAQPEPESIQFQSGSPDSKTPAVTTIDLGLLGSDQSG